MKKVGILTSGGDCQALNAALRGVAKCLFNSDEPIELYGFIDGYKGLINCEFKLLEPKDFAGILTKGGTIIGTSRTSFKSLKEVGENGISKVTAMKDNYKKLGLECLVVLGGNGSHKTANLLREEGLNIITLPKTIDNDLYGTEMTFGFQSAVEIATNAIDLVHTTASSHGRIFLVELMGHKVGWLALHAGIAGGADVILIPEIPYDINKIVEAVMKRKSGGRKFTILAVAEGAISKEMAALDKREIKELRKASKYPSVTYEIAAQIEELTGIETRVTVPGHMQRGGSPCAYDRMLANCIGAVAASMVLNGEYGYMLAIKDRKIVKVPLGEVAGKLKKVDPQSSIIKEAKLLGISFGD